jgi:hypothetical protein
VFHFRHNPALFNEGDMRYFWVSLSSTI